MAATWGNLPSRVPVDEVLQVTVVRVGVVGGLRPLRNCRREEVEGRIDLENGEEVGSIEVRGKDYDEGGQC